MTTEETVATGASSAEPILHAPVNPCPPEAPQVWSGPICPSCHKEEFRFKNGVCVYCDLKREKARDEKAGEKRLTSCYKRRFWDGSISLADLRAGVLE